MNDNRPLLEVQNLKKYFKTKRGMLHAVDDVTFTIGKGKTLGVVGESGCGKSTTGRAILRLIEPTGGCVLFDGEDISRLSNAKMRAKRNTVKGIIQRLNEEADTARRYLDICELEVLEPRYTDDFVLKLLYELINKGTSLRVKLPEGVFDMTTEVHGVYGE